MCTKIIYKRFINFKKMKKKLSHKNLIKKKEKKCFIFF